MPIGTGELGTLLAKARNKTMTEKEREEQRRSFAFGNAKLANDDVTRESIDREAVAIGARPSL